MVYKTKINGQYATWSNIRFDFLGNRRVELTEIKYTNKLEGDAVYTTGPIPSGGGLGNYLATLELKLTQAGFEEIEEYARNQGTGILNLDPFEIIVQYKIGTNPAKEDKIPEVRILEWEASAKSGDKTPIIVPVKTLVTGVISWNGVPAIKVD